MMWEGCNTPSEIILGVKEKIQNSTVKMQLENKQENELLPERRGKLVKSSTDNRYSCLNDVLCIDLDYAAAG